MLFPPKLFPTDCRYCTEMECRDKKICRLDDLERFSLKQDFSRNGRVPSGILFGFNTTMESGHKGLDCREQKMVGVVLIVREMSLKLKTVAS